MGPAATRGRQAIRAWQHQLTDEERRAARSRLSADRAALRPQRMVQRDRRSRAGSRPWPYPDRSAYASRLFTTAYRSQTARYNRLIEDIRNDVNAARSVLRHRALRPRHGPQARESLAYVSQPDRRGARQHAARACGEPQHRAVGAGVAAERAESYQIALERLVIAAPSPVAVEAERALTLLQQRIAGLRRLS